MACPMFNLLYKLHFQTNILWWLKEVVAAPRKRGHLIKDSFFSVLCQLSNIWGISLAHMSHIETCYVCVHRYPELSNLVVIRVTHHIQVLNNMCFSFPITKLIIAEFRAGERFQHCRKILLDSTALNKYPCENQETNWLSQVKTPFNERIKIKLHLLCILLCPSPFTGSFN